VCHDSAGSYSSLGKGSGFEENGLLSIFASLDVTSVSAFSGSSSSIEVFFNLGSGSNSRLMGLGGSGLFGGGFSLDFFSGLVVFFGNNSGLYGSFELSFTRGQMFGHVLNMVTESLNFCKYDLYLFLSVDIVSLLLLGLDCNEYFSRSSDVNLGNFQSCLSLILSFNGGGDALCGFKMSSGGSDLSIKGFLLGSGHLSVMFHGLLVSSDGG